jgi:hypothetical protein
MIIMTVVDNHGGLCFNQRRQSQDRKLRQRMLEIAGARGIWMDSYSASMFTEEADGSIRPMIFSNRQAAVISALSKIRRCFPMQTVSNRLSYSAGTGHIRLICILTLLWTAPGNCRKVMIFPDFLMILLQKRYM